MEIILLLIFISILVTSGFLAAFIWNVKRGDYEDTYSPSVRILFDEEGQNKIEKIKNTQQPK
jgi:cbb3-type cytochrome oxidase maturation protein